MTLYSGNDNQPLDFSFQDLRGRNFNKLILEKASFVDSFMGVKITGKFTSCLLSFLVGCLLGFLSVLISRFLFESALSSKLAGLGSLLSLVFFWATLHWSGPIRAITLTTSLVGSYGTLMGILSVSSRNPEIGLSALSLASTFTLIVGCLFIGITCAAGAKLIIGKWMILWIGLGASLSGVAVPSSGGGDFANVIRQADNVGITVTVLLTLLMTAICQDISKRVLLDIPDFGLLRRWAVNLTTLGSTSFQKSNLKAADFSGAKLAGANFSGATLDYISWSGAQGLRWAKWDIGSPLSEPKVIELLTRETGESTHYKNLNLSFTNLANADLRKLILVGSNLTATNLRGANLEGADLSDVRAIGTDFTGAKLTGACVQNWRIDASTHLGGIDCRYVFLAEGYQDRQPASGEFEPGDFAKLYQTVVDTFDLIFRNGIDWRTFQASLEEARRTHPDANLTMQSVESKGDGYVIIKLQVESNQDKEHLHQLLKQIYAERQRELEGYYQQTLEQKEDQIETLINLSNRLSGLLPQHLSRTDVGQTVLLSLLQGSLLEGLTVSAQVWSIQGQLLFTQVGQLPAAPELLTAYQRWQKLYQAQNPFEFDLAPVTNFSLAELSQAAEELKQQLNLWLGSVGFLPIAGRLRSTLEPSQQITVTWQTEDPAIQQLPLHCWNFFDDYPLAALTWGFLNTRSLPSAKHSRPQRRVLSVLGMSGDIDVERDGQILDALPEGEVCILRQPGFCDLTNALWDSQGWDIFCFSGHSALQGDQIWINDQESISLNQMEYALMAAAQNGLSVSIFNCCQGIRLAQQFANVVSAGVVVMREPVPDAVAQAFLQYLLEHLENQQPLAHSLKNAREQLQGMEREFPWVSWLPMAFWLP
jgi:uncharacterized protein YjbI with pentapeptide repeats